MVCEDAVVLTCVRRDCGRYLTPVSAGTVDRDRLTGARLLLVDEADWYCGCGEPRMEYEAAEGLYGRPDRDLCFESVEDALMVPRGATDGL